MILWVDQGEEDDMYGCGSGGSLDEGLVLNALWAVWSLYSRARESLKVERRRVNK